MKKIFLYFLGFVNLLIIFIFWWLISGKLLLSSPSLDVTLVILGRITGLLAVYFILLQFLIIGRVRWLERVFGFDKLTLAHHYFGITALILIIVHLFTLVAGYASVNGLTLWEQFKDFNLHWDELFPATIGAILFVAVAVSSITIAKKRLKYQVWYYVHLITYLAIIMAFGHQLELGRDLKTSNLFSTYWVLIYLFVGINFIFYRFFWQFFVYHKFKFYVSEIKTETADTASIYIKGDKIENFKFEAGQFLIIRFLNKKLIWQAHPYSISSLPGQDHIRITAKNLGDFSAVIKDIKPGTKVLLDGPNGIFTKKKKQDDKILLVAGGVGITPLRALAEEFLKYNKDVVLLYAVKKTDEIIFKQELEILKNNNLDKFKIYYIISQEKNEHGFSRIDENCIKTLVPDVSTRDAYLCGPVPMSIAIKKYLINLKVNKHKIYYEKFSI